jgi:hypothetical protein
VTTFLGSKMPPLNGYGQNGFHGASSDLPGQNTRSDFLPDTNFEAAAQASIGARDSVYAGGRTGKVTVRASASKDAGMQGPQTRDVGVSTILPAFGMLQRSPRDK